jgi:perosamine synthetase
MKKSNFIIPWSLKSHDYTNNEITKVADFMRGNKALVNGNYIEIFEKNFSRFLGTKGTSYAVSSGSSALEMASLIIDLKKNDEVIIPAHTYCASALSFLRYGAKIKWADINLETFTIDVESIIKNISKKTKAIIITHLYGMPCEIKKIVKICKKRKIILVEDCAQALGASHYGKKVGTFGDISVFSFHAQKNMSTLGAGGMLVVNNKKKFKNVDGIRRNGHRPYLKKKNYWLPAMVDVYEDYKNKIPFNFPFTEIQSIVGIELLKRVDKLNKIRIKRAKKFIYALRNYKYLIFQKQIKNFKNVYHLLPAYFDPKKTNIKRDDFIKMMSKKFKIQTIIQYQPLYRYHLFKMRNKKFNKMKNSDLFYDNMVSFPFHVWMKEKDFNYIIKCTKECLEKLDRKNV